MTTQSPKTFHTHLEPSTFAGQILHYLSETPVSAFSPFNLETRTRSTLNFERSLGRQATIATAHPNSLDLRAALEVANTQILSLGFTGFFWKMPAITCFYFKKRTINVCGIFFRSFFRHNIFDAF